MIIDEWLKQKDNALASKQASKQVLVACEESQRVCSEFRRLGFEAYSCDLIECSGGHPEWHIQQDVLSLLNGDCEFTTMDGIMHKIKGKWSMLICHPVCQMLCVSGNRWFNVERYGEAAIQRAKDREKAVEFFMAFVNADCEHIAIENPIGIMSTRYRKPDQIIQPFQFGHPYTKQTCLWLKGLPKLKPTNILEKPAEGWVNQSFTPDGRYGGFKSFNGSKERSKTFEGIAKAMAEQWGPYIVDNSVDYVGKIKY